MLLSFGSLDATAADLKVNIHLSRSGSGSVVVAVYKTAASFPKPLQGIAVQTADASTGSAVAVFHDLTPGRYAVAAYQDRNGNRRLDKNMVGIPTEPYGFSNGARGSMGPPSFESAAFDVPPTATLDIHLH
jgi:uncharacterized protein (DUF2141 family)